MLGMARFSLVHTLRAVFPLALAVSAAACSGAPADGAADESTVEDDVAVAQSELADKHAPQPWVLDIAASQNETATSVVTDGGGHVYIAGTHRGALDLGDGPLASTAYGNIYLAKFAPDGRLLFNKTFPAFDALNPSLALDADGNILMSGTYCRNLDLGGPQLSWDDDDYDYSGFVAKFDEDGDHLWSKNLGSHVWAAFTFPTVGADEDDNVYVAGVFKGPFDQGAGPVDTAYWGDMFLLSLDPDGNHRYSRHFGPDIRPDAIAVSKSGEVALGGYYYTPIDIGGGQMPRYADDWGYNGFIARFDAAGDVSWTKAVTRKGYAWEEVMGVGFDKQGDVIATGMFEVSLDLGGGPLPSAGYGGDVFLAKFDGASGAHVWSKSFTGNWDQVPFGLAVDRDDNIALAGRAGGAVSFGGPVIGDDNDFGDAFVAKFDPEGNHLFSVGLAGPGMQEAGDVALDRNGNLLVVGSFEDSVTINGQTLSTGGGWTNWADSFAARILVP